MSAQVLLVAKFALGNMSVISVDCLCKGVNPATIRFSKSNIHAVTMSKLLSLVSSKFVPVHVYVLPSWQCRTPFTISTCVGRKKPNFTALGGTKLSLCVPL